MEHRRPFRSTEGLGRIAEGLSTIPVNLTQKNELCEDYKHTSIRILIDIRLHPNMSPAMRTCDAYSVVHNYGSMLEGSQHTNCQQCQISLQLPRVHGSKCALSSSVVWINVCNWTKSAWIVAIRYALYEIRQYTRSQQFKSLTLVEIQNVFK